METILIVDDEKNYPLILSAVLQDVGYETLTANSGMEALEMVSWYGLWGPKDLPPEITAVLAQPLRAMSREPETRQRLGGIGVEPVDQVGAEFAAFIAQEVRRNDALLKAAKFQPE